MPHFFIMQVEGLEPSRGCPRQILSLMRLPFRHTCILNNVQLLSLFHQQQ